MDLNNITNPNQEDMPAMSKVEDTFLPSLYRTTLILGMLGTAGIGIGVRSTIWAGSFFFGVLVSLAFLKSQEIFLRRMLQSFSPSPHKGSKSNKTPKIIWFFMIGKYFVLAGIMAAALHFEILNLIGFVLGFSMLHVVMFSKVLMQRGAAGKAIVRDPQSNAVTNVTQRNTLNI